MSKQKFILDTSAILEDYDLLRKVEDQELKAFLIEGYNPIIAKLEKLYKEDLSLDQSNKRLESISEEIEVQLKAMGGQWTEEKINESLSPSSNLGSSSSMPSHLAFVRRAVFEKKQIKDIVEELSERLTTQTKKDFPRIAFNLIDQNNNIIYLDGNKNFAEAIEARMAKSGNNYLEEFKAALKLTDKQFKLMISRFNQRGIEGAGMAIVTKAHGDGPRENNLYVNINEDGEVISTKGVENKYTVQKAVYEEIVLSSGRVELFPREDEYGNIVKVPVSSIAYRVDISNLSHNDNNNDKGDKVALPTQKTSETLTFEALDIEAIYQLPHSLKHRTRNNQLLWSGKKLSKEQIEEMVATPNLEKELLPENLNTFISLENNNITEKIAEITGNIIKDELRLIKENNTNLPKDKLVDHISTKLANALQISSLKNDKDLKEKISQYLDHNNPNLITKISQHIHAFVKGMRVADYQHKKLLKRIDSSAGLVLKNLKAEKEEFKRYKKGGSKSLYI